MAYFSNGINFHVKDSFSLNFLCLFLENVKRKRTSSWLAMRTRIWIRVIPNNSCILVIRVISYIRVIHVLVRFIGITGSCGLAKGILDYPLLANHIARPNSSDVVGFNN